MIWHQVSRFSHVSDCGCYEIRGSYARGRFEYRGRNAHTDELVIASNDLDFVKGLCANHASTLRREAEGEAA